MCPRWFRLDICLEAGRCPAMFVAQACNLTTDQGQLPITNNVGCFCSLLIACLLISAAWWETSSYADMLLSSGFLLRLQVADKNREALGKDTLSHLLPLQWCHPVILITSVSSHSIQDAMSSRSITIVSSGRSTGPDYSGNRVSIPVPSFYVFEMLQGRSLPPECVHLLLVIRVEEARRSALLEAWTDTGGRQRVWYRLHPWPHQQLWGLQPTYKWSLQQTFSPGGKQTPRRERYKSGLSMRHAFIFWVGSGPELFERQITTAEAKPWAH